ncbi:MAG: redox-regulated ATPase YchF [Oscillospiraceae bacterium]|nr:redox-regulated ATPase YchF [Oscillospiraceae bacterium]
MKLGIVGLPNVGKTTLFNALTGSGAATSAYAYTSATPNVGVVKVPDTRLDWLSELYDPQKYTPATIEFVDIAGLAKGASRGEGLGNKFLQHIRQTDALVHVVRCFENPDIFLEPADAARDAEALNLELILADIEVVERRVEKAKKMGKGGDKSYKHEEALFSSLLTHLSDGKPARSFPFEDSDLPLLADGGLLSVKPVIYCANMDEGGIADLDNNANFQALKGIAEAEGASVMPVCAALEQDIYDMSPEEQMAFLEDLGITERGLDKLIACSYDILGLISFLTAGKPEVRAWTITKGTKAPKAAGKIHSDIERGFIRAEVVAFEDLKSCGNMQAAKEKGLVRLEGKEYVMKDGDVVLFRFNV